MPTPSIMGASPLLTVLGVLCALTQPETVCAQTSSQAPAPDAQPRLVLQITVDQLRGDLPLRYLGRFTEGGFRYLLEQGTAYMDAHHAHANTETIVGHTTLATGTFPSQHGMIGNVWFDREAGGSPTT